MIRVARSVTRSLALLSLSGLTSNCGTERLDLGRTPIEGPWYATPASIAAEADAGERIPTLIAAHQFGAQALAVDATRVYWSTAGEVVGHPELAKEVAVVRSCTKADCAGTVVTYATSQWRSLQIAVSATQVFWNAQYDRDDQYPVNAILTCPIAGCTGAPRVVATTYNSTPFVIDDTHVYWVGSDATVLKRPLDGSQGVPTLVGLLNTYLPQSGLASPLVVDATNVYVMTGNDSRSGMIVSIPKDGSGPTRTIAEGRLFPAGLAVDATNVYWSEGFEVGSVRSCSLAGCTGEPTVVTSEQVYPGSLAVDAGRAYFLRGFPHDDPPLSIDNANARGEVLACPLAGCGSSPTVLAVKQWRPRTIAIDDTHVYWTTFGEQIDNWPAEVRHEGLVQRIRKR